VKTVQFAMSSVLYFSMTPKEIIERILKDMGVSYTSLEETELLGNIVFAIKTEESKQLIGRNGETLRALTHIVKKMVEKAGGDRKFGIDVNGYRANKIKELEKTARLLAERARSLKYDVEMAPMSAYERMVVHSVLADEKEIETESRGEGRDRRLVIKFVQ
jgi:spoIIIJ-associated protein